jgi:hypothetical protein
MPWENLSTILRHVKKILFSIGAAALLATGLASPASAFPGGAFHNGHVLVTSNATRLPDDGALVKVSGFNYSPSEGYFVAVCQVPADYSYTALPTPCAGGRGHAGDPHPAFSAWVTNSPTPGSTGYPITKHGSFSVQIKVAKKTPELDCGAPNVTCAIVTRRDFRDTADRSADVFIPISFK